MDESTARDYAWTCPFCRSALAADFQADDLRRWTELHHRLELVSVIRIQAFCRMFVCQSRYIRFRQALVILQVTKIRIPSLASHIIIAVKLGMLSSEKVCCSRGERKAHPKLFISFKSA